MYLFEKAWICVPTWEVLSSVLWRGSMGQFLTMTWIVCPACRVLKRQRGCGDWQGLAKQTQARLGTLLKVDSLADRSAKGDEQWEVQCLRQDFKETGCWRWSHQGGLRSARGVRKCPFIQTSQYKKHRPDWERLTQYVELYLSHTPAYIEKWTGLIQAMWSPLVLFCEMETDHTFIPLL